MSCNYQVSEYINGLKSRHAETRRKSIRELYRYAKTELREMPQDTLASVLDDFNQHIHALVSSNDVSDKKAGILTIVCLIGGDTDTTKARTMRYANYLTYVFPSSEISVLELAAKANGRLATTLGIKKGEFVETEIKAAFDWLTEERNEGKRLSAVLKLRELAIAMPSYFYHQINGFFNHIMIPLRDPKEHIREQAAKALRAALVVTSQRENSKQIHKAHWYQQCFEEATKSFADLTIRDKGLTRDDHVHSGLLILNELFRCSNTAWEKKYTVLMKKLDAEQEIADDITNLSTKAHSWTSQSYNDEMNQPLLFHESGFCHDLIADNYERICTDVMAQQLSRSPHVHQMLLLMIPRLAAFNREVFTRKHLQSTINHLITFLQGREKEKVMAFTTLGLIAVVMENEIQQHLKRIIDIIKTSLSNRDSLKKQQVIDSPLFNCITLLAFSMKEKISDVLRELLDSMCVFGLSLPLATCFKELSQNIPSLKKDITDRLLNMLSIILRKKPYLPQLGCATPEQLALLVEPQDATKLVLALRTLGSFDFEWEHVLYHFVKRCTEHYLQSDYQEVRLESVRASAKLLTKAIEKAAYTNSTNLCYLIDDNISLLLSAGLTDFDDEVRYWVFEIFTDPIFDNFLAIDDNLNKLFIVINDENLDLRELAMCIIGRLSSRNPSYTSPTIRQMYVQYVIELQHSGVARNKEQAIRMINNLILHAPAFTRPYVDTVLNALVPNLKAEENSPGVVISILKTIGDLADVNGDGNALNKWTPGLTAILIEMLSDTNSTEKRSVTLWCFAQLISATGYVIAPYIEYPDLMNILIGFFKTEQQPRDRREAIRILGLLGALDPYKHKVNRGLIDFQTASILIPVLVEEDALDDNFESDVSVMLVNMSPLVLEEFYPAIAVTTLMTIVRDTSLHQYHTSVVHATIFIFQSLGIKCVPYISRIVPTILYVIRTTDNSFFCEFLFGQLAILISVVKVHIRNYLDKIFQLITEFWNLKESFLQTLVTLVENIAVAIGPEFKIYLPKILPKILTALNNDNSKDKSVTEKLLVTLQKFGTNLDDVLQVVVPAVTRLFHVKDSTQSVSKLAMETIMNLSVHLDFKPYSSRIIHPLAKVLESYPALRATAMNTLCALIIQLGRDYNVYIPSMAKLLSKHKIYSQDYEVFVTRIMLPSTLASDDNFIDETRLRLRNRSKDVVATSSETATIEKVTVNENYLRRCWAASHRFSKEDWLEWRRRLSIAMLNESASPAIRACSSLIASYPQIATDLFNASFMSCWTELNEANRKDLVTALELALTAQDAPELTLTVLNLSEFMEHCEKGALPISRKLLGDRAISCRAYAKAVYYKEEEYRNNPSSQVVEALIHINNKLQQKDAAMGLIQKVMLQRKNNATLNVHVRWYEKLHNWGQALDIYNKKLETEPQDEDARLGQMRCLEALGEWEKLHHITSENWENMSHNIKTKSAKIAAAASWGLQQWDAMRKHVAIVPENSQEGAFYRSILAIHDGLWVESRQYIDEARSMLETELSSVAGESYQRAYPTLVTAQLLTELEEVVSFKLVEERRNVIRQAWWTRLQGGEKLLEDWRKILQVRSLVLSPREDFITWLKLASLCRKNGALSQANNILSKLLGGEVSPELVLSVQEPLVTLTYTKNLWMSGEKRLAYELLQRHVEATGAGTGPSADEEHCRLLARCHLKLGHWCEALQEINEISIPDILQNYAAATVLAADWYKAWHAWAYMNFETVLFYKQQDNTSETSLTTSSGDRRVARTDFLHQYVVPAIEGFFKSISLSHGNSLQDTLRLLTLWFDYGHNPVIYETLFEGVRKIEVNIWLQVIPQLIARIDSPRPLVAKLINSLLVDIGKFHPQALVYPLTVASKSSFIARKTAANQILKTMCPHSQNLVTQAAIISEELIRVAILWHDQWFIGLDEASRLYFSDKDVKGMFKTLEPLHAMLDRGPQSLKEQSFVQMYGRDLREAQDWCNRFKETGNDDYLNLAWDLYYLVFRRIDTQFRSLTSLELQYVSQKLLNCRNLELAVPGSYAPCQEVIRIAHIHSNLQVIKSKQHPRRLTIRGSDGKDYMFLLKGHEDLRQDERVMQLFGLVNTLLKSDNNTYRHQLAIQRYAIVPLSTNSGLIGWVPHCDTLYNLISDYRKKKPNKIALGTEQQIMMRMGGDPQKMILMQKVEVFEHTLEQTTGNDLARLLWLKSPSAEVWFERRNNYTRSLAVMSMVGYILGLGDRHPSNIMLHRVTGKVLHIDFGDCFEVTLTREKFPEKIPFRLTRMLINAMEVTGIEGTYRNTCESVMEVLHKHKDSVMAVLEAFVYDPLLNWRLVETGRHSMLESSLCSSDPDSPSTLPSRSRHHHHVQESIEAPAELNQNKRALTIINRIRDKLTGRDFPHVHDCVNVSTQVDLLIQQATSNENLCQCFIGWCPFW